MAPMVRSFDWSKTPLGPMDRWPQSLRTAVDIVLAHPMPMILMWGPQLTQIYNDGYAAMAGGKHPAALGQPTRECWPEVWHLNAPLYERVLGGESVQVEDQLFPIARHGAVEDAWFSLAFAPLRDDGGRISGFLLTATETTARVVAERERARLQAVEAMRRHDDEYRSLFKAMDEGFLLAEVIFDGRQQPVDLLYLAANPAAARMTRADYVGRRLMEIDPNFETHWLEIWGRVARTGVGERHKRFAAPLETWFDFFVFRVGDEDSRRVAVVFSDISDRVRAEDALRAGEARLRALATASGAVLYRVSADWSEVQPLDGKGLIPSTVQRDRGWMERNLPASEHAAVRERISHCIATKSPFDMEHRVNRPDGSVGWTRSRAVPVLDDMGEIAEWVGTADDVTERREVEAALRASEERATAMVESIADGFFTVDRDWRLTYINGRGEEILRPAYGRTRAQMLGRSLWELFPEVRGTVIEEGYRRAVRDGVPVAVEVYYPPLDGWYDLRAYPSRDGLSVYFLDVTERKRAEEAVRASEGRRRLALDSAELGTWNIDMSTKALTSDERFRMIFHGSVDPITYAQAFAAIHADDRERVRVAVEASMRPNDPVPYTAEYRVVHPDGSVHWVFGKGRPNVAAERVEGRVVSLDGTVADITDRKTAEAERERLLDSERTARVEAERAGRMKDEFLATLSHELRTPLNAILGWSQILRSGGGKDAADLEEGLATIERNARAQTQIIEDLLDMSRIVSGTVRMDVRRLDLAAVVQAGIDTVRPAADAKGVRLHAVLDPAAGPVSGDPNRLQQVCWNLVSNAIKFTPRGGRVQVLLERVNSHVEVSVSDTGQGISPEFLPHVWDRFRQADGSTTRRHGGLGLGLSIVKQLVELHGGSVRVKSAGPGHGTTFTVSVPLAVVHPEPEPEVRREHPASSGVPGDLHREACLHLRGVRVLVVDDEADARAVVRRLLEDCEAVVRTASSAAEAFEMFQSDPPDVLVSDIGMPEEDGYSLIRRVRALGKENGGNTPSLALTAYARPEDRMRAVRAGFHLHVVKPVEPVELITMVATLSERAGD